MSWLLKLFTSVDRRIVKWAMPDEYIPLKCEKCGAIFVTKNRGPIGSLPIHYGKDYNECIRCEKQKHHILLLTPNKRVYLGGDY